MDDVDVTLFWSNVQSGEPDECWPWLRMRNKAGYGVTKRNRWPAPRLAHRVAWAISNGPIPGDLDILHSCDNPPCCNPAHLSAGTHLDNMQDMIAKGRHCHGDRHRLSKFSEDEIRAIRADLAQLRLYEVVRKYGAGRGTIVKIRDRITWRHVD